MDKAKTLIEAQESLALDSASAEAFFDAMLNPPEPNARLKKAAKDYNTAELGDGTFNFPTASYPLSATHSPYSYP